MPAYADNRLDSKAGGVNMARLCRAMKSASTSLASFRRNRTRDIRDYVGANYGENGSERRMLNNGLSLYVQVMSQALVGQNPRFMLSTPSRRAKPTVSAEQEWVNEQVEKIGLGSIMRECVVDSLFCLGITKVALSTPADSAVSGWHLSSGEPFAANIDLDDFTYDIHARRFEEASFIAHRFRMPLDIAREWKEFDSKQRKELHASDDPEFTSEGDERTAWLSRNEEGLDEEFEEMVDLWEVWLPRHKLILTMEHEGLTTGDATHRYDEPLRVQKWVGPDKGPYHFLASGPPVPDNAMPKALIQDIRDMNSLINNVWRKIEDDARNFKVVTAIQGVADADGKRTVEANHGEAIRVDNPEGIKEIIFRGVNPVMMNFVLSASQVWNKQAGNIELQAGTAPQSRTASQDKMLNENAGAMMAGIQGKVTKHVASVGEALIWYYHHHPELQMESEYVRPGLPQEFAITRRVEPKERIQIPWKDLKIKVDPYSLPFSSPSEKLAILNSIVQQTLPMLPLLQQQGASFDIQFYLQKIAEYTAQSDIPQLFRLTEPPPQEATSPEEMPHMLQGNTTRTYERRSVGQESQAAQEQQALNMTSPEFSQNEE